jgi:hypothetical protein
MYIVFEPNASQSPFGGFEPEADEPAVAISPTALSCHLAYLVQPTSTTKGAVITGTTGSPSGPAVAVQVQDSSSNPVSVATPVALMLSASGLSGGGPSTTSLSSGSTTFAPVDANSGLNLTLTATAADPAIASATSNKFTIYDSGTLCSGSCSTVPATGFSLSATGTGFLAASVNPISLSCSKPQFGLYPVIPGTVTLGFTYINGGTKTVTFFVAQSLLTTTAEKLQALYYLICYTSPTPFKTVFGSSAAPDPITSAALGAQYYTGLLPDCAVKGSPTPPCVQSRTWVTSGPTTLRGVYVTVLAPAGDPFGR